MRPSEWAAGLVFLAVLAALPFAGHWSRDAAPRCANSGGPIEPLYRVRVVDSDGQENVFCCIGCAEHWLTKQKTQPRAILVTDEISGEEIQAGSAYYVRSLVVTNRTTGNRIHVFRERRDAEAQARSPGNHLLDESEKPFAGRDCCDCSNCCPKP